MTIRDIRSKYLAFFKERGHVIVPSASLRPENDPTTLFTGSGMQPLLPYLLGASHPSGRRIVNSQKCFRAGDIDEIGDNRHTSFFEMLGNWSLGDYFKEEQLQWFFQFLTDVVGLDPARLYVTVFAGDEENGIPLDTEAIDIWERLFATKGIEAKAVHIGSETHGYEKGMQGARIFGYDARKNWWSRAGVPENMPAGEPGGPDSEVFFDFGTPHDARFGKECHPNCDCGRFMEIGNSVFMEYLKQQDGSFAKLPQRNVDFGGGLERIAVASEGVPDVFSIDVFRNIISRIEALASARYSEAHAKRSFRIVADHLRGAVFMIGDGVTPANADAGYFARRLIRRSVEHLDRLGVTEHSLVSLAEFVIDEHRGAYPRLGEMQAHILSTLSGEEEKFRKTLHSGRRMFEKLSGAVISGADAFALFSTHGFPLEVTVELAKEKGMTVDVAAFEELRKKHQELSRAGSEQKFKGGLADSSERTVRLHTAHHLLLRALQLVLGGGVKQRGSNITQERLRIDFSHGAKLTKEELLKVERIVNEKITEDLPVIRSEMTKEEAEALGAEHEFGQKYGDRVSVYSVGPAGATSRDPQFDKRFSIEFCGGPHVAHTGALAEGGKRFRIQKEEAVAAGIRRIKAVLE